MATHTAHDESKTALAWLGGAGTQRRPGLPATRRCTPPCAAKPHCRWLMASMVDYVSSDEEVTPGKAPVPRDGPSASGMIRGTLVDAAPEPVLSLAVRNSTAAWMGRLGTAWNSARDRAGTRSTTAPGSRPGRQLPLARLAAATYAGLHEESCACCEPVARRRACVDAPTFAPRPRQPNDSTPPSHLAPAGGWFYARARSRSGSAVARSARLAWRRSAARGHHSSWLRCRRQGEPARRPAAQG